MKYWVYLKGEVPGCYRPDELATLKDFGMTTLVCPAEGEILEKNWRRAGELPEVVEAVRQRTEQAPPPTLTQTPLIDLTSATNDDVDAALNSASTRLFGHVSQLMQELSTQREEKALVFSLQDQLIAIKEELRSTRARVFEFEAASQRAAELEILNRDSQKKIEAIEDRAESLEHQLKTKESELAQSHNRTDTIQVELSSAQRNIAELEAELTRRQSLSSKLNATIEQKELSLAKAMALIRRLEEDLHALNMIRTTPTPVKIAPEPTKAFVRSESAPSSTADISPQSAAHSALTRFLKKVLRWSSFDQ